MTPEAQGAFCGVCQKSVIDFSKKSAIEVQSILEERKDDKICGRFSNEQLGEEVIEVPLYALPKNMAPLRAFALAVFLVFGTLLFSGSNAYGQKMGKVKVVNDPELNMIKGDVNYEPQTVKGLVKAPVDTAKTKPQPKPLPKPKPKPKPVEKDFIKGKVAYNPNEEVVEVEKKAEDAQNRKAVIETTEVTYSPNLAVLCYPNPTGGLTSIRYSVKRNSKVNLDIYDLSGKKVKTLMKDQSLYAGVYTTAYDLSDLHTGVYVCCFSSPDGVVSTRISVAK